jgi:Family of unknown function (DUF6365)
MKLLYLSLSAAAFGETFIGLALADQLRRDGVENHFLTPPATEAAVRHFGFPHTLVDYADCPTGPEARAFLDGVIAEVRPDALVLADYNAYARNMKFHFRIDPWCIEEYGLPILPIDLSEWANTSFEIDLCGRDPLPVSKKILDFPAHLRPVPTAHVDPGPDRYGFPYRVVGEEPRVSARERAEILGDLGLGQGDRLVMVPMSSWQQPAGGRGLGSDMSARLTERVPELLAHYLSRLPASTHFLVIGEPPPAFSRLPSERTHVMPPCSIDRYTALLGVADLIILFSPTSATGARGVLMDRQVLIFQNRFTIGGDDDIEQVAGELGLTSTVRQWLSRTTPIEPFRMWPKGCYYIQEPMFAGNDYLTAFITAEIIDETGTVTAMENALYDPGTRDRLAEARAKYNEAVGRLPKTTDVVMAAIDRAGEKAS